MTDISSITPVWLEFHDLRISRTAWNDDTYIVEFDFGTVFDATTTHYGYRFGKIYFTNAVVNGIVPTEENIEHTESYDEPMLWTGTIQSDEQKPAMIPLAGLFKKSTDILTQFIYPGDKTVEIRSSSLEVDLTGRYPDTTPAWNVFA